MERTLEIQSRGIAVHGLLTQPEGIQVRQLVLGVHGFGGSIRDEIQEGIAEEMGMFGAAMVRFDLPSHGESPCDELTLPNCVNSLLAAAQEARRLYPEVEDLCIFATGFGAYVTLVALNELLEMPGNVRLVVQTPSVRMDETVLAMANVSRETLRAMGQITFPLARPLTIRYPFFEEVRANSVMMEYPIPMLILQGEEDAFINMSDIQTFHRLNEDSRLVVIPGASHQFLEEGAWDMVLDLTRDWFAYQQVLLSDWD